MEEQEINQILLKTAFSVMVCDGEIDNSEIEAIKLAAEKENTFGDLDISSELDAMRKQINNEGHRFLQKYFSELESTDLSKEAELEVVKIAINTIYADQKVQNSEVKFFKVIRSVLNISNEEILEEMPDIEEFLEDDIISKSYIASLKLGYLDTIELPKFEEIDFGTE